MGSTGVGGASRRKAAGGGHGRTDGRRNTVAPGVEDTRPGRISCVWNVGTPSGSGGASLGAAGQPTVRKAGFPGGNRTPKKRMPAAERPQESGSVSAGPPAGCSPYNWPDTGPGARLRKQADVWRVSLCRRSARDAGTRTSSTPMTVNGTGTLPWSGTPLTGGSTRTTYGGCGADLQGGRRRIWPRSGPCRR